MTFINRAEVTNVSQVLATGTAPTASWGILNGVAFQPGDNAMAVINAAPDSTDPSNGARRLTPDSRLYVWTVGTLGVPPVVVWNAGLPYTPDGRLVVTSDPISNHVAGWPVSAAGWVCMSLSGPPPVLPGAFQFDVQPAGIEASYPRITWTASAGATSYTIRRDGALVYTHPNGDAGLWDDVALAGPGLGGTYSYTMSAFNASGSTPSTSNPQGITVITVPGQATNLVAIGGNTQATVSFTPGPNGGLTQSYVMDSIPTDGTTWPGSGSPIVATGLTNGVSYVFRIFPYNSAGSGPVSAPSNAVVPSAGAAVPTAPTIGTASAPTSGQATVTFTPIPSSPTTLDFRITSTPGAIQATVAGSPGVITGLTNGMAYTFKVEARNAVGYSLPSAASNSVTPPYSVTPPGPPTIGTATGGAPGSGQATITFTPPAYNGGPPVTSYTVTSSPGGITASGAGSPLVVSGLSGGTPYTFRVTATNSVGTGPASAASNSITLVTVPAAPTIGTATSPANGQLSISFIAPNNGGSPITGYTATTSPGGFTATGASSPILFTGLAANTYTVTVTATNAVGTGPASAASNSIAVAGSGPVPIFNAPLIATLVPTVAGGSNLPTFTRSTTAYVTDFEGILRQEVIGAARFRGARRVRNLFTGSTTLVSQTPTLPLAGQYVLSFKGTGTIVASGAGSATLVGQGAATRVGSAPFTCTPAGLTCTVTGTVTEAQLEFVSGATNQAPAEYVSVGVLSNPWHGAGMDGIKYFATTNGNTVNGQVVTEAAGTAIAAATLQGFVSENARQNGLFQSQTFSDAQWVKTNGAVVADNAAAPDGTLTADTFTASATNGTITNTVTFGAGTSPYPISIYIKRAIGAGNIQLTADGGATWTTVAVTTAWARYSVFQPIIATNPVCGVRVVTSGDAVQLWGAQLEAESVSSYIPTTTAAVTRSRDQLSYASAGNILGTAGTFYSEVAFPSAGSPVNSYLLSTPVNSGAYFSGTLVPQSYDGTNLNQYGAAVASQVPVKSAFRWSGVLSNYSIAGAMRVNQAFDGDILTGSSIAINCGLGATNATGGTLKDAKIYSTALTDAEMNALTT